MGLLIAIVRVYSFVLLVRIIFSWLPPRYRATEFYAFIHRITEPVMRPFRRIIPPAGGIDFSPIVIFILLEVIVRVLSGV